MLTRTYKRWKLNDISIFVAQGYSLRNRFDLRIMRLFEKSVPSVKYFKGRAVDELDPTQELHGYTP
jgi:hypothetical protein